MMSCRGIYGTLFLLVIMLLTQINAVSETLYYYEDSDTTADNIRLETFYIEGSSDLVEGSIIFANFTFLNVNKLTIYGFEAFLKVKRPDGETIEQGKIYREKLSHLERITCNITLKLDMPGNWSIWPSYRFFEYQGGEGERSGPDYWHAYNFSVREAYPDLVVQSIVYNENKNTIEVTIANIGDRDTGSNFAVAFYVDEELIKEEMVSALGPSESKTLSIDADNLFYGKQIKFGAFVDSKKWIDEENEDNNYLENNITPPEDKTPPRFIEYPSATNITFSSAEIRWKTNELSTAIIEYGERLTKMNKKSKLQDLSTSHHVVLSNLKENTVYTYRVTVVDTSGNKATSRALFFKTLSYDNLAPSITLDVTENVSGTIRIGTDTSDDRGIDRVVFYLDNRPLYVDYNPPFDFTFDTRSFDDGSHVLEARAFDAAGNMNSFKREINIRNRMPGYLYAQPYVKILSPANNASVLGDTPIVVRVDHYTGIERVEFWIDNELEHVEYTHHEVTMVDPLRGKIMHVDDEYEELPFEKTYNWYALSIEDINRMNSIINPNWEDINNKSTVIEVRAYDRFGMMGNDSIIVYHQWESPPEAIVSITRNVRRVGHYFVVNLTIGNYGYIDARDVTIVERHMGFQPGKMIQNDRSSSHYEFLGIDYDEVSTRYTTLRKPYGEVELSLSLLPAHEFWHCSYELFPILAPGLSTDDYKIKSYSTLTYISNRMEKRYFSNTSYEPSPGWTEQEVLKAFKTSDYLIVTNPVRLYSLSTTSRRDENELLLTMAELAREKRGILGYLMFQISPSADDIDRIIESWGKNYLNESWEGEGYLLLVGETEIIPSFVRFWSYDYDLTDDEMISDTDYPYASTRGEEISPELHIGRIIGNTAADLIIPIRSSLEVHYHLAEFNKGHGGKAVCISGWGDGESDFWSNANSIGTKLENAGFNVVKIRGYVYQRSDGTVNQTEVFNRFRTNSFGASVIYYRNHGNSDGKAWSGVVSTYSGSPQNVNYIDFGNARPFVFACCCCAGQYEDNPSYSPGGENGIAEGFMKRGAGVYIGSTEISMHDLNGEYSNYFFDHWLGDPGKSIAEAWKETRREAADEWWFENDRYWSAEYQFYGDPKFGE